MSDWLTRLPRAAQTYIDGRRLDEVECIVSDIAGVARGKAMPASKFARQESFYLPNSIFLQTITGEWADNPSGAFTEPDMILVPDFETATAAPWTADVTLQVIHDAYDQQGNPVPVAPRNVLRRVVQLYADKGWKPLVAPEMEFFLVARNIDPNQPIVPPMGRSGRRAAAKQAYSLSAVDEYGKVIDDIYDFAEAQGNPYREQAHYGDFSDVFADLFGDGVGGARAGRRTTTTGTPNDSAAAILGQVCSPPESFVMSTSVRWSRIRCSSSGSAYGPRLVSNRHVAGSGVSGVCTTLASTEWWRRSGMNRSIS